MLLAARVAGRFEFAEATVENNFVVAETVASIL